MPAIAAEVIELIHAPASSAEQLARVVSRDASMAAKILQIANSSFYSMSRKITTLSSAIVLIGERTLKNLVLAVSLQGMNRSFGATEKILWEDSIICALGSRFLAQRLNIADPEEAFLAGLFRHIGKIVMLNQETLDNDQRQVLQDSIIAETAEMQARELRSWGATHDQIGAAVIEQWQLSESLSLVALHHFDMAFDRSSPQQLRNLISLVNIANILPEALDIFGKGREALPEPVGAKILGLSKAETEGLITEFCSIFTDESHSF
jgi:HD-like signal output (HDOD) protein